MTYPTTDQLAMWSATLTATNWTKLASRLNVAIERDRRGGSAIPDGYPATTLGGSGGTAELTPTEAAAHARSLGVRDEHHDRTTQAVGYLEQTLMSLAALVTHLDKIEARVVHVDGRQPGCAHHARHGLHEERFRGDCCRACYLFKLEYGSLPPGRLLDDRARGIKWTSASIARALGEASVQR